MPTNSTFGNWETAVQGWVGQGIDAFIAKKVTQPYEIDKLKLQTFGDYGFFNDGQNGLYPAGAMGQRSAFPTGLLIGGAVLVGIFMLVKD